MKLMFDMFCFFGFMFLCCIAYVIVELIYEAIKRYHRKKSREHIQKHRFDKPPTAKCYCIDCKHWNKYSQGCRTHSGWWTADDWFCKSADPRVNGEDYEERKEADK